MSDWQNDRNPVANPPPAGTDAPYSAAVDPLASDALAESAAPAPEFALHHELLDGGPYGSNEEHLWQALAWVEQLVRAQTVRWHETIAVGKPERLWGMAHVTEEEVQAFLGLPFTRPDAMPEELRTQLTPYWQSAAALLDALQRRQKKTNGAVEMRLLSMQAIFGLQTLDTALLLLCLLPELDSRYRRLYGYLQDDASHTQLNLEMLQQVVEPIAGGIGATRRALSDTAPLLKYKLLVPTEDTRGDESISLRFLRPDDRIVDFLLGGDSPDSRLQASLSEADAVDCSPSDWQQLVVEPALLAKLQALAAHLRRQTASLAVSATAMPVLFFRGPYGSGQHQAAGCLAHALGRPLLSLSVAAMLTDSEPWAELVNLACREARLRHAVLEWRCCEILLERDRPATDWNSLIAAVETHPGLVVLDSNTPWEPAGCFRRRRFIRLDFTMPSYELRRRSWLTQLPRAEIVFAPSPGQDANQQCEQLAAMLANGFQLSHGQIADAIATARAEASSRDPQQRGVTIEELYEGCRRQSSRGLISYARLIEPRSNLSFDDLILPDVNRRQLNELRNRIRYRSQVYSGMGFEHRLSLGRGLIALFTGSSGTGKTMSAELLGREYGMQLYKVDLAAVVSKYVGETEKNLSRVFREAEDASAILFFDEGEALFGKRGEVKEARDRWANIEVNYLLQRVEEYAGVVILTTNFRQNMDPAFLRRIHVTVDFPRPDAQARLRIWRGMFPAELQRPGDEDLQQIAEQFNLVGGSIKNAVLDAAFRALGENSPTITLRHLVLGIAREQQKQGMALTRGDFGLEFYEWVSEEIL